jgi:hypothetical protein
MPNKPNNTTNNNKNKTNKNKNNKNKNKAHRRNSRTISNQNENNNRLSPIFFMNNNVPNTPRNSQNELLNLTRNTPNVSFRINKPKKGEPMVFNIPPNILQSLMPKHID